MSQDKNNQMLAYMGVDKLHASGYKGNGIKVMIIDNVLDADKHEETVKSCYRVSAPNAIIEMANGEIGWQRAIAEKFDIVHISMTAFSEVYSKQFTEKGGIVTASTGNSGDSDSQNKHDQWNWIIDIGACYIDKNGIVQRDTVTKSSEYMDFTCFTPYIQRLDGAWYCPIGTSFSSPFGSGSIACLLEHWKHIGYKYTPQFVKQYLIDHAVDILAVGKDNQSGYGYVKVGLMKKIELEINGKAFIDGVEVPIDVPAMIINKRTMVPVRFLSENLGCTLQIEQKTGLPVSKVIIFQEV